MCTGVHACVVVVGVCMNMHVYGCACMCCSGWCVHEYACVRVCMNNHVHRALLENTERMRKENDKKGNAQKRLTLLNK